MQKLADVVVLTKFRELLADMTEGAFSVIVKFHTIKKFIITK